MKASEIKTGGFYTAKVSGQIVTVQVDEITERNIYRQGKYGQPPKVGTGTAYCITNMRTGRKLVFKSAQKFRQQIKEPKP